jgi:hypothetical protein
LRAAAAAGLGGFGGRFLTRLFTTGRWLTIRRAAGGVDEAWWGNAGSGASRWIFGTRRSGRFAAGSDRAGSGGPTPDGPDIWRIAMAIGAAYPMSRAAIMIADT